MNNNLPAPIQDAFDGRSNVSFVASAYARTHSKHVGDMIIHCHSNPDDTDSRDNLALYFEAHAQLIATFFEE